MISLTVKCVLLVLRVIPGRSTDLNSEDATTKASCPSRCPALVPITVHELAFWVPVEVGNIRCMAQLDTGSAHTLVTQSFSTNFEEVAETKIRGAFRQIETRSVRVPSLKWLGGVHSNLVVRVRPDFAELPFQAGVTLGNSVLLAQPLYLDFTRIQVGVVPPSEHRPVLKAPLLQVHGLPILELGLGDRKLRAIFDLGAGFSVMNERIDFQDQELILSEEGEDSTRESRKLLLYRGPSISLDGHTLGRAEYTTINLREIETILGTRVDFIIGANTLLRVGGIWKIDVKDGYVEWG